MVTMISLNLKASIGFIIILLVFVFPQLVFCSPDEYWVECNEEVHHLTTMFVEGNCYGKEPNLSDHYTGRITCIIINETFEKKCVGSVRRELSIDDLLPGNITYQPQKDQHSFSTTNFGHTTQYRKTTPTIIKFSEINMEKVQSLILNASIFPLKGVGVHKGVRIREFDCDLNIIKKVDQCDNYPIDRIDRLILSLDKATTKFKYGIQTRSESDNAKGKIWTYKYRDNRHKIIKHMGLEKSERVVSPIKKILFSDENEMLRETAAEVLGELGCKECIEALHLAVQSDENVDVRKAAKRALSE